MAKKLSAFGLEDFFVNPVKDDIFLHEEAFSTRRIGHVEVFVTGDGVRVREERSSYFNSSKTT